MRWSLGDIFDNKVNNVTPLLVGPVLISRGKVKKYG